MSGRLCTYCHINPITGRLRKFCSVHSLQASAIWKRQHPDWRTPWKKTGEERRAYFRTYMRTYRLRKRSQESHKPKEDDPTWNASI